MNEKILKTFKYKNELYTIKLKYNYYNDKLNNYITVITPENCFGYSDSLLLTKVYNYSIHNYEYVLIPEYRHHSKTLINKALKYCLRYIDSLEIEQ